MNDAHPGSSREIGAGPRIRRATLGRRTAVFAVTVGLLTSVLTLVGQTPASAAAPDKTGRIAYTVEASPGVYELWTADATGSNPQKVLGGVPAEANPAWHPTGGLLAVERIWHESYNGVTPHIVQSVDPNTGDAIDVTAPPEPVTRTEPCPTSIDCTVEVTDHAYRSDRLIDWSPDGAGMLVRRTFHAAFADGVSHYWHRITGAGGMLTDTGRTVTFPGTDDWSHGEPCPDAAISSPEPETTGNLHFLADVNVDRYAVEVGNQCDFTQPIGTNTWYLDGAPLSVSYPVENTGGYGSGLNTIAPNGLLTVHGPGGLWETTSAGTPTTPLTMPVTTPFPVAVGWLPDPGCYASLSSGVGEASWASDRSFVVFDAEAHVGDGASSWWPEPYASAACQLEDVGEEFVSGVWKVSPTERIPRLIIEGGSAPDVECFAGSCLTLLSVVTTASNVDVEDDPQFTYSGAVSGTTGPVTPLGTGGTLSALVTAGPNTVLAHGATDYVLDSVDCGTASATRNASSVTVTVVPDEITACTFHYVNGDPDPCILDPTSCDADGDRIPDDLDPCPQDPLNTCDDPDPDPDPDPDRRCTERMLAESQMKAGWWSSTDLMATIWAPWCTVDGYAVLPAQDQIEVVTEVLESPFQSMLDKIFIYLEEPAPVAPVVREFSTTTGNRFEITARGIEFEACVNVSSFVIAALTGFGAKKALQAVPLSVRRNIVNSFTDVLLRNTRRVLDGAVTRFRDVPDRVVDELFSLFEVVVASLSAALIESGAPEWIPDIPDPCVTTLEGDLKLILNPNGTVVGDWTHTGGAPTWNPEVTSRPDF